MGMEVKKFLESPTHKAFYCHILITNSKALWETHHQLPFFDYLRSSAVGPALQCVRSRVQTWRDAWSPSIIIDKRTRTR